MVKKTGVAESERLKEIAIAVEKYNLGLDYRNTYLINYNIYSHTM